MSKFIICIILIILLYYFVMKQDEIKYDVRKKIYLSLSSLLILALYLIVDTSKFPDLPIYKYIYENIVQNGTIYFAFDILESEKGYLWLNIILKFISDNFNILRIIIASFIVISLSRAIYKYSDKTWLSLILFLCTLFYPTIYTLRQSIAVFIFLYGIKYIIDRNLIKYLLCIGIAFLFHKTSLVCIILYFLYPLNINKRNLFIFFCCCLVFLFTISFFLNRIGLYISDINTYILEDGATSSIRQLIIPFLTLFFSLFVFRKQLKNKNIDKENQLFFGLVLLHCGFSIVSFFSTNFNHFYRLNYYFFIGTIFLIPNSIHTIKKVSIKNISTFLWIVFWVAYMYILTNMQYGL